MKTKRVLPLGGVRPWRSLSCRRERPGPSGPHHPHAPRRCRAQPLALHHPCHGADPCRGQALSSENSELSTEYEEDRVDFATIPQEPPGRRGRLDRHDGHSRAPPPTIGS
nr:MAG TPA: hypothetical protein [Caudoviricetes sp.]